MKKLILLALILSTSSCSLFSSAYQDVTINTPNKDATICLNGRIVGKGKVTLSLPKKHSNTVTIKVGDKIVAEDYINTNFSTTGILDLIGGFFMLFPFIGLLSGGAWELDRNFVDIRLE